MKKEELSSPHCAHAAQCEAIHFKSKCQAHIECDDRSPRPEFHTADIGLPSCLGRAALDEMLFFSPKSTEIPYKILFSLRGLTLRGNLLYSVFAAFDMFVESHYVRHEIYLKSYQKCIFF